WMLFMLVTGAIYDSVFAFLFAGLLVYVVRTLYNLNKLNKWLANPSKQTPELIGIWGDVYYQLSQLYKRQRKARRKLTSILNRFQKSTQALPDATIVLNKSNEIEWFNPAASQMFNLQTGIDKGKRINNLIHSPKFVSYLIKKDFKKPLKFSVRQKKIILGITPYGDGQYLISARDITTLSQIDDMRRNFISNASHELRTPLTVMSGYIEFLHHKADENTKIPLEKIQQQTVRMDKIITEMIDLAKLESAAAVDYTKTVDIKTLLNDVYKEALSLDQNKHHIELATVAEDPDNEPALNLHGSYEELRMALSNLLTNAIRYTPEAKAIKLFSSSNKTGISICVQDHGVGINYQHIPRLTERFYRVDEGRSREQGGTGLGLAIVKHVLDRHNATLHIQSEPGKGSTFCCEFPLSSIEH
ncbi:MAG: phosphate regulon sensor histidine kinase PhoR, partial [Gammaproteobacteria bacterium]|nr:phosphate regulon sensor histidine kinase PhoR [Gammaproteobacteria bacterium]